MKTKRPDIERLYEHELHDYFKYESLDASELVEILNNIETDLIKIKKISQEREDENWYFRTFLKGYDIKNLDSVVHKLFEQVSEAIDCTACGNCCKEIQPILKKKDINKLSKSLNIPPDQFITKYVDKDEDGDNILNQLPCPFLNDNNG